MATSTQNDTTGRSTTVRNQPTIEEILSGWRDIEKMTAHVRAISEFRRLFEESPSTSGDHWCQNGFTCSPGANSSFRRSKMGILMIVSGYEDQISYIHELCTPFGQVKVVGGGHGDVMQNLSRKTFERLHEIAKLIDVTETLGWHYMNLSENNKYIRYSWAEKGSQEDYDKSKRQYKIYLLHFHEKFPFAATVNVSPFDSHVFWTVNGNDDEADEAILHQATNGRGIF